MTLKSTDKLFVARLEDGKYRLARRHGRSALTGKFLTEKDIEKIHGGNTRSDLGS